MFKGTITALITPFMDTPRDNPAVDYDALTDLIEWQLGCGVTGFVSCGTTGESATLDHEEKLEVIKHTVKVVKGRVPVIAGTGTNCTKTTVELTREAKELKVDAALIVSPYYNKPTQEGLLQHFSTIAREGGLPLIVYNIPGRTAVDISIDTFRSLAKIKQIVAVKESSSSADKLMALSETVRETMAILSGEDSLTYLTMAAGGQGVISAAANAIPERMSAITSAALAGRYPEALQAQIAALPAIRALFAETNPAPAKAALKLLGRLPNDVLRLPLVSVREETRNLLSRVLGISA